MFITILSTVGGTIIALGVVAKGTLWILDRQYATREDLGKLETKHTELLVALTEIKVLVQGIREYLVAKREDDRDNSGAA